MSTGFQTTEHLAPCPRKKRLQELMEQQVVVKRTAEVAHRNLEKACDENLENASFSERQDLITTLGIMVYPSEAHKVVRIATKLPIIGKSFSP